MRLLKIIIVIFAIYFIRRFIQLYKAMQKLQIEREAQLRKEASEIQKNIVEADFRVMD